MTDKIRLNKKKHYIGFGYLDYIDNRCKYKKTSGDIRLVLTDYIIGIGPKIDWNKDINDIKKYIKNRMINREKNTNIKEYNVLYNKIDKINKCIAFDDVLENKLTNKYDYYNKQDCLKVKELTKKLYSIEIPTFKKINKVIYENTGQVLEKKDTEKLLRKIKKFFSQK